MLYAVRLFTGKKWYTVRTFNDLKPAIEFAKENLTEVKWDIELCSIAKALKIEHEANV